MAPGIAKWLSWGSFHVNLGSEDVPTRFLISSIVGTLHPGGHGLFSSLHVLYPVS
jgi:hypothetical protein